MSNPPPLASQQLLADIEMFAASTSLGSEQLTQSELRALARAPLDIDLTDAPPRVTAAPPPPVATPVAATPPPPRIPAPPQATVPESSLTSTGLLAKLKRQAEEKLAAETKSGAIEAERIKQMDLALRAAYRYLDDLAKQLNVIKPDFPGSYPLGTILRMEKLKWHESKADFRRKIGPTEDLPYDKVTLRYLLRADGSIVLEKQDNLVDATRKSLHDFGLTFTLDEKRNMKGYVERGRFVVTPEIKAGLLFEANYETGEIHLRTRNVQRFGSADYLVPTSTLTEQTLEEIALLILGESNQFVQRFKRIS